jgi:hypothetical protein
MSDAPQNVSRHDPAQPAGVPLQVSGARDAQVATDANYGAAGAAFEPGQGKTPSAGHPDAAGLPSTTRTEAFSDGVFAIVITLLVLDLANPRLSGCSRGWSPLAVLGRVLAERSVSGWCVPRASAAWA